MIAAFEARGGIYHPIRIWFQWCRSCIIIKGEEYSRRVTLDLTLNTDASSLGSEKQSSATAAHEDRNVLAGDYVPRQKTANVWERPSDTRKLSLVDHGPWYWMREDIELSVMMSAWTPTATSDANRRSSNGRATRVLLDIVARAGA